MGYVQNPVAMALQQNKTKQLLFSAKILLLHTTIKCIMAW